MTAAQAATPSPDRHVASRPTSPVPGVTVNRSHVLRVEPLAGHNHIIGYCGNR